MKQLLFSLVFLLVSIFLFSLTWIDCCWKKTSTGLEYKIEKKGKGKRLRQGDSVNIHWIWFECETEQLIENSSDFYRSFKWSVGSDMFVKGFEEGFSKLKRRGKAYLKIPPELAFGKDDLNGRKTFCYFIEILDD
jgi:FKBP-type peptidyl-prolyl cis-trans isomerase FkpA